MATVERGTALTCGHEGCRLPGIRTDEVCNCSGGDDSYTCICGEAVSVRMLESSDIVAVRGAILDTGHDQYRARIGRLALQPACIGDRDARRASGRRGVSGTGRRRATKAEVRRQEARRRAQERTMRQERRREHRHEVLERLDAIAPSGGRRWPPACTPWRGGRPRRRSPPLCRRGATR